MSELIVCSEPEVNNNLVLTSSCTSFMAVTTVVAARAPMPVAVALGRYTPAATRITALAAAVNQSGTLASAV